MADVFREFTDANMHRAYPLTDDSPGNDKTGTMKLPTALVTDIFMCVPDLPVVDKTKFYIANVLFRRLYIDITIGYEYSGTPIQIGMFKNIRTDAVLQTTYEFSPFRLQDEADLTPLFYSTGQITIGDPSETLGLLGSWSFDPDETWLSPTRISQGVVNVQFISINDRLFTGTVKLREGVNTSLDVSTAGDVTTITVNAELPDVPSTSGQLSSDADILQALTDLYGVPILTVNGLYPDEDRNFNIIPEDCTQLESIDNKLVIGNPCARPCCEKDETLDTLKESIANQNLRYAQIKSYFDAQASAINDMQRKLTVLGSNI